MIFQASRPARTLACAALVLGIVGATEEALAQGTKSCPWGRDPVTLACRAKPVSAPPPPPRLELATQPQRARVYRGRADAKLGCVRDGEALLGETPVTLSVDKGIRAGHQTFCLEADGFAPTLVEVEVAASGVTRPEPIKLASYGRVVFAWRETCPYRIPPEEWQLRVDGPGDGLPNSRRLRSRYPLDPLTLTPGDWTIDVSADDFEPGRVTVPMGPPGSDDQRVTVCLQPKASLAIGNKRSDHPLDGLFLRVARGDGKVIWQGEAPRGKARVDVPVRPEDVDAASVEVFADPAYRFQVPPAHVLEESAGGNNAVRQYQLDLQVAIEAGGALDRSKMTSDCLKGGTRYCASEAYLRVHVDRAAFDDRGVRDLLAAGCRAGELASCAAAPPDLAARRLAPRCDKLDAGTPDGWLLCMRERQPDVSPARFLMLGGVAVPDDRFDPTLDIGVGGMTTLSFDRRPGAESWVRVPFRYSFKRWLALEIALRLYDVGVVPAETSAGAARGYFALGGVGLEEALCLRPSKVVHFRIGAALAGFFTASASVAGGYADIAFDIPGPSDKSGATVFELALRGGVARYPRVLEVTTDEREPHGALTRGYAGLGFTWVAPLTGGPFGKKRDGGE